MAVDDTAKACKQNLQLNLAVANAITREDRSPAGLLLHTINESLKTIVDTNFNQKSSLPSVGRVYETIGTVWASALNESGQNLALLYIARSLAVVLEEAVRRLGGEEQANQSSNVTTRPPIPAAVIVKPVQTTTPVVAAVGNGGGNLRVKTGRSIAASSVAAVAVKPAQTTAIPLSKTRAAARYEQRARGDDPRLDYSPEAIAGRVNIYDISYTAKTQQLVQFLKPIDSSFELIFPLHSGCKRLGTAYVKFMSNEKADEAVRRLTGTNLNGRPVKMKRMEFWFKEFRAKPILVGNIAASSSVDRDTVDVQTIHGDTVATDTVDVQTIHGDTVATDTVDAQTHYSVSFDSDDLDVVDYMAVDATAQACKQNLQTYLGITNFLTQDDRLPTGSLLCTMNELLKTIVDSNFNQNSSLPAVGRLYETISNVSSVAINQSGLNLALFYFARSLVVVLEESVRRLGREEQTNQSPIVETRPVASAVVAAKPAQTAATGHLRVTTRVETRPTIDAATVVASKPVQMPKPAAAAGYKRPVYRGTDHLDYSPEAVAGRVNIYSISYSVKREQLINFLKPIDTSFELIFPHQKNGVQRGFAYVKFKNNEKADEAVRKLNGMVLNGRPVKMERTPFWFKTPYPHAKAMVVVELGDSVDEQAIEDTVCSDAQKEQAHNSASLDSDDIDHVD